MASLANFVLLGGLGGLVWYFSPSIKQEINNLGTVALKVIQSHGIDVNLTNRASLQDAAPRRQPQELRNINYVEQKQGFGIEDTKIMSAQLAAQRMDQAQLTLKRKQATILPPGVAGFRPLIASSLSGDLAIY